MNEYDEQGFTNEEWSEFIFQQRQKMKNERFTTAHDRQCRVENQTQKGIR
jgi:hypothetical protein